MANIPLDELQIDIVVNSQNASSGIKELASNLRDIGRAGKDASKGLSGVAHDVESLGKATEESKSSTSKAGDSLKAVSKEAEKTGKSINKLGKQTEKATGKFHTFLSSIGRIAMYRAIRSGIKAVTQAVSEGFNMFVTWDRESNNSMAGVAANVDKVTAKWTMLKGQIGAAAGALFNSFAPVITWVLDGLTKIIDVFQMVIRSLQGEYTYYKLIYKEAEATTGAAKELKRVLFGFDDLNVLPSQTGGGAAINNGSWEYAELPIDSKFLNGVADVSNDLKEFFNISDSGQDIIGGLVGVLGFLLGGKALGGLLKLLPGLISGFNKKNQSLAQQTAQTQAETSAVSALVPALAAVLGGATALGTYLKSHPFIVTGKVEDPTPKAKKAFANAKAEMNKTITIPTSVQSVASKATAAWTSARDRLKQNITIPVTVADASKKATSVYTKVKSALAKVITIPTAVASAASKATTVYNSVKKILSKTITIPTKVASATEKAKSVLNGAMNAVAKSPITINTSVKLTAISALETALSVTQAVLGSNPLMITTSLFSSGLASALAATLSALQTAANKNPIVIPVIQQGQSYSSQSSSVSIGEQGVRIAAAKAQQGAALESLGISLSDAQQQTIQKSSFFKDMKAMVLSGGVVNTGATNAQLVTWQEQLLKDASRSTELSDVLSSIVSTNPKYSGLGTTGFISVFLQDLLQALFVGAFANGGLIPNTGSLFLAGERGAEVVADMGSHTGVMNVDQMQDAVIEGNAPVVEAIYAVLRAIENKDSNIYLDGAKVGQSVTRYQSNQMRRGVAY